MASQFLRVLRLYGKLQILHLRVHLEYEADFWIGILGAGLRHTASFIFIWTLFSRIPLVNGWSLWEIAFLYGLSIIPVGLVELLYDGQWELRRLVNQGEFDRLLLRPLSPALQVITQLSSIHGLGSVLLGFWILAYAAQQLHLVWSVGTWFFLFATLASSILIIGSLNYITNCSVFWDPANSSSLPLLVQQTIEFAKYPVTMYGRLVQVLITWVLPLTFVSYYPGLVMLGKSDPGLWLGYAAPLAGPVLTLLTAIIWHYCLKAYQGVGN